MELEEIKDNLITYFKNVYLKDIIFENNYIMIDLEDMYKFGFMEVVEKIVNNPKNTKFLEECFKEAFFSLKGYYPDYNLIFGIKNLPKIFKTVGGREYRIRDIKSRDIGKLIEFEGIIVSASKLRPILKRGYFICKKCGKAFYEDIDLFEEKKLCCGDVELIDEKSIFTDFQELKIQEPVEFMENPEEPPKYITVFIENSPGIYAGRIKILGEPIKVKKSKKLPIYDIYVKAYGYEILDSKAKIKITEEDKEKIKKLSKINNIIDILADRLIPEIRGNILIKKAVFLQQIKGVKKPGKRADIHILLITDPGIGKTVILRKIADIPGNVYGSITTATGVGLTAAVVKERTEIGEEMWVVKPGLLVKANKGTACIDELTVNKEIQNYVLEAMESQTIHISKGGINVKLPAECSVLAACNPKWGRFDNDKSVAEQINIPPPLLSRFDLIFPIKDISDKSRDKDVAEYIVDLHRAYLDEDINKKIGLDYIEIEGIKVDRELIIKYIFYAREKKPVIGEKAKKILVDFYIQMRKEHQITARQLEAAIRLAEAHAKARLKDVVDEEDVKEALKIITECLKEIAYDPETGIYDVDKIIGVSKKEREKLSEIYNIIKELNEKFELVEFEDIVEIAKKKGYDEEEVSNIIKKLIKYGDIDEARPGRYRIL